MNSPVISVPDEVVNIATESIGAFFEPIAKIDRHVIVQDFLHLSKAYKRITILRVTSLRQRKLRCSLFC